MCDRMLPLEGTMMTEYVTLEHGRLACDVVGDGPLVVLSHGMGTLRQDFRLLLALPRRRGEHAAPARPVCGVHEDRTDHSRRRACPIG